MACFFCGLLPLDNVFAAPALSMPHDDFPLAHVFDLEGNHVNVMQVLLYLTVVGISRPVKNLVARTRPISYSMKKHY